MNDVLAVDLDTMDDKVVALRPEAPVAKRLPIDSVGQVSHDPNIPSASNDNIKKGFLTKLFNQLTVDNLKKVSRQTLDGFKQQFTADNIKKQFTMQAGINVAIGAGVSIGVKAGCVTALGTVSFPATAGIIVSAVAAGALSASAKIVYNHLRAKYKGEETEKLWTMKNLKAVGVQSLFGGLGGSVAYALSDQITGALNYVAKSLAPYVAPVGAVFTTLWDTLGSSTPAPVATPIDVDQALALSLPAKPDMPVIPALESALPHIEVPSTEVSMTEFAKMPVLLLPDAPELPKFAMLEDALGTPEIYEPAKIEIAPLKNLEAVVPPMDLLFEPRGVEILPLAKLEDVVAPPVAENTSVILPTPSPLERAAEILKGQKNVSPYIQQRLTVALDGDVAEDIRAQAKKDLAIALREKDSILAGDLITEAANEGNTGAKVDRAWAKYHGQLGFAADREAGLAEMRAIADKSAAARKFVNAWTGQTPAAMQPSVVQQASVPKNAPAVIRPALAATQAFTAPATPQTVIQSPQPAVASRIAPTPAPVIPSAVPKAVPSVKGMDCILNMFDKGGPSLVCTGEGPSPFANGQEVLIPRAGLIFASPR